jgi:hypothetical protein
VKIDGPLNSESRPAFTVAELNMVVLVPWARMYPREEVCGLILLVSCLLQAQENRTLPINREKNNLVFINNLIIIILSGD